jgi:hypothetical protein
MANSLELSIYTFTLKDRNSREDFLDFDEFYRKNFTNDGENPLTVESSILYERFVGMILDEFENKFWLNADENKGISTRDIKFRPGKDLIEGIINGGNTGYGHEIFNILNNEKVVGEISRDQLASLPYYFKMWTPPNSQVGVLMVQSYSIGSINTLLTDFIKTIFTKYGTTFNKVVHIPKNLRDTYIEKSVVRKVTYTSTIENPSARKKFNRAFEDSDGLRITITVQGLKKTGIKGFLDKFRRTSPIGFKLKELGMINPEDYETKLFYEDENGRKANAKIQDSFEIRPTIVLPDEIMNQNRTANLELIVRYTDGMLKQVMKEIDY